MLEDKGKTQSDSVIVFAGAFKLGIDNRLDRNAHGWSLYCTLCSSICRASEPASMRASTRSIQLNPTGGELVFERIVVFRDIVS